MKKNGILMAYFSLAGETYVNGNIVVLEQGNTDVVAHRLAAKTEMDLFHIEKLGGYPFTYKGTVEIAKEEWKNDARPELTARVEHMEQYDTLILGYPNWCGTMPKPVFTFLESYDLKGKRIVPFCTNEGSGLGKSMEDLKKICPDSQILPGTSIHGAEAADVVEELDRILEIAAQGKVSD